MKLVISLGGTLLTENLTTQTFKKYVDVLKYIKDEGHKLVIVCGGGKICREYQQIAKELGGTDNILNRIGIQTTHLNAYTMIAGLGNYAYPYSARTFREIEQNFKKYIVVTGGLDRLIGPSTDYDSVLFAERIKADRLINVTDVDGVYSEDPNIYQNAKKFHRLTYSEFRKILLNNEQNPLETRLFDISAVDIIERAKIKTIVIDGHDPTEIIRAVDDTHNGTIIE